LAERPVAGAPDRFLLGIALGAVALLAVGIAVVVLFGRGPGAPPVDPGSPVGIVQAYAEAVRQGDSDRARALLSQSARDEADRAKVPFPRQFESSNTQRRLLIEAVEQTADRAHVKVTVSTFSARTEPFSSGTWHREIDVWLVREGGQWRIASPTEPYAFTF